MVVLASVLFCAALSGPELLVSVDDLAAMRDDFLVVDANPAEAYEAGHIPGATNLDANALSEERDGVKGRLKPVDALVPVLEAAGIATNQPIVVYSHMEDGRDLKTATRVFWVLDYLGYSDVRLLDGGLAKWKADGHPVEEGPCTVPPIEGLEFTPNAEKLTDLHYITHVIAGGGNALYDCRSMEEFTGEATSSSVSKGGHIPGAIHSPADAVLNADGTFKPADALKHLFPDDAAEPISYCNTGRSATVGFFTLRLLGRSDAVLYDGSMSEYTLDPDAPVETGAPAVAKP